MKRIALFILSGLFAAISAKAEILYYEGTGYWNVASHWWTDTAGTPAGKTPNSTIDVVVSNVTLTGTINTSGINVKSLTFDKTVNFGNTISIAFTDGFTVGNDLSYTSPASGNMFAFTGKNNSMNIDGSLKIDSSAVNKTSWFAFFEQGNIDTRIGKITVGKDLELTSGSTASAGLSINVKDFIVGGKVKMSASNTYLNLTRSMKIAGTFTNNFTIHRRNQFT